MHILDIPAEILLLIFSHLPSQLVATQIPLVCKRFRNLVATSQYWRTRYVQLAGAAPFKEPSMLREWQEGCFQIEFPLAALRERLTLNTLTGERWCEVKNKHVQILPVVAHSFARFCTQNYTKVDCSI